MAAGTVPLVVEDAKRARKALDEATRRRGERVARGGSPGDIGSQPPRERVHADASHSQLKEGGHEDSHSSPDASLRVLSFEPPRLSSFIYLAG